MKPDPGPAPTPDRSERGRRDGREEGPRGVRHGIPGQKIFSIHCFPNITFNRIKNIHFPLKMGKARKKKEARPFDMSKYRQRHLAFHVQYDGGKYHGFADQLEEEGEETVERHIFNALIKLRLITDKKSCQYSRCGRTDRGVSALGQVIALKVRSSLPVLNTSKDDDDKLCILK